MVGPINAPGAFFWGGLVVVFFVLNLSGGVDSAWSGKGAAERRARAIGGYVDSVELDEGLEPFAFR